MQETWVLSLGWEDTLEESMATHSSILAWRIPMDREAWWVTVHEVSKSWTRLNNWAHMHTDMWDPNITVINITKLVQGFPGGSDGKVSVCNAGDPGSIPGSGRSPGEGNGYPLQYSFLVNSHEQRSLASYSPWSHKESDTTEQLSLALFKSQAK